MSAGRQMRHHGFGFAARGGVAAAIGKARHGGGLGDVTPLRVGAGRIERDAERIIETGRKYEFLRRLAAIRTQDGDTAARLSATNMSSSGAVRIMRGPLNPAANRLTAKPGGTRG